MMVGGLQAIASYGAQSAAADAQNQYYAENAKAAQQAAVTQYAHQQNQIIQKRNAAGQEILETKIEGLKARATAHNAAGEAGITGLSVDALVGDYYGREGRRITSIDENYMMDRDYMRANMDSTQAQAQQRINSVQRASGPSFGDAMIRIAGSVVGGMGQMARQSTMMNFAT